MKAHIYASGLRPILVHLGSLVFLVLGACGLSRAQTGPASLVLDKNLQGTILIIEKSTDEMILELEKALGKDIEVGLEKGDYTIINIRDGKIRFYEISLSDNHTIYVNEEELRTGQAFPALQEGPEITSDKDTLLGKKIPTRLFVRLPEGDDYSLPVYRLLEDYCLARLNYYLSEIVPIKTDKRLAKDLAVKSQTALISFEETGYSDENEPILWSRSVFRDDLLRFRLIRRNI